jgi:hypothetical protein
VRPTRADSGIENTYAGRKKSAAVLNSTEGAAHARLLHRGGGQTEGTDHISGGEYPGTVVSYRSLNADPAGVVELHSRFRESEPLDLRTSADRDQHLFRV